MDLTEKDIPQLIDFRVMSAKVQIDSEIIERFCNKFGVTIDYTPEQSENLKTQGKTQLLVDQLNKIAEQICANSDCLKEFIEKKTAGFHPVSMSLFVINDALWKIMARKDEHPERMLPMTTIPWFYWDKEAVGRKTPFGVRRLENPDKPLKILVDDDVLEISGNGGDFCGVLEGRIVDKRMGIRPMFIPGSAGPKMKVARYVSEDVQVRIAISSVQMTLYPIPEKDLDYIFSEHPRVFYEHGILITTDGDNVKLKVGSRKENSLHGKVMIFIGKAFEDSEISDESLTFHVWLSMLKQLPFR
jgi:hypothetical protein